MTPSGLVTTEKFFKDSFSTLIDPRRTSKGNIHYSLDEILFLTISAAICGYTSWTAIAQYGRLKIDWFRKFFPYKQMPSHDAISDLFCILDSKKFATCFLNWVNDIASKTDSEVVAIDGKTIRGAASKGNKFPLHIVSCFCTKNRLTLGQVAVSEKSNEIIAIPKLLELLTIDKCIVTIDAIGCQKSIAAIIRNKNADYILQVKDNQLTLKGQIEDVFNSKMGRKIYKKTNSGHGRIEKRICEVISADSLILKEDEKWKDLKTIVRIESHRTIKKTLEKSIEFRYYITSLKDNPTIINNAIRSHWGIENNLHWNLDVIFGEDGQLKRKGNSAENFNVICKAALALVDNEKSTNLTKPLKMLTASIDDSFRERILKI